MSIEGIDDLTRSIQADLDKWGENLTRHEQFTKQYPSLDTEALRLRVDEVNAKVDEVVALYPGEDPRDNQDFFNEVAALYGSLNGSERMYLFTTESFRKL